MSVALPREPRTQSARWIPTRAGAAKIALAYALFGALWILASGWGLHAWVSDPGLLAVLEDVKGWFFIAVTACLLGLSLDGQFLEIRRSAELLEDSNERFRLLSDAIPEGIILLDADGGVLAANATCAARLGVADGDCRGKNAFELVSAETAQRLRAWLADVIRTGRAAMHEDESTGRFVRMRMYPVPEAGGRVSRVMVFAEDVTDHNRAEVARRQWADAFEHCGHGIGLEIPATNRLLACNPAFARMLGTTVDRLSGAPTLSCYAPEDQDLVAEMSGESDRVGQVRYEGRMLRRDGSTLPVQTEVVSVRDAAGAPLYRVVTVEDITPRREMDEALEQRRRAQEAALASSAKLEAALASMTDAVVISDAQGNFIHFNDAFATYHKFKNKTECAKTLAGNPALLEVFGGKGELIPLSEWAVPRALRGESVTNAEYSLRRKDTGETWAGSYTFAPIRDGEGKIVGAVVTARDVTEQKRVEAALRESQARYRLVSENASDVIWLFDVAANRFIFVSPSIAKLRGFSIEEAEEQTLADALTPESLRAVMDRFPARRAAFAAGDESVITEQYELSQPCKDGSTVPTEVVTTLIASPDREITHIQGVSRDITERKRAEAALRESEAQFRAMFEVASIGMVVADPTTRRFLRVNEKMCLITGYSEGELTRMEIDDLTHPDDHGADPEKFETIFGTHASEYRTEKRYRKKDGTDAWVNIKVTVVRDQAGRAMRTFGAVEDITSRVRADAFRGALLTLGARLNKTQDAVGAGRALLETADKLWKWDAASLGMYPIASGQLRTVLAVDTVDGVRREVIAQDETETGVRGASATDGSARPPRTSVMTAPIHRDGLPIGTLRIESDALNAYTDDDRQTLRALADYCGGALDRIRSEAQLRQAQKLEAIGLLAGGIAHDFNNILGAIMMHAGLLQSVRPFDKEVLLAAKDVETEAQRAATLTQQLLMFSRRSVLAVQPLNLNSVVQNLLKMLRRVIGEQIEVRFEPTPDLPAVAADAGMMDQVLMNLVVNARDAMPKGGVISIRTYLTRIDAADGLNAGDRRGAFVCLSVADTGTGMDPTTVKRVFEPFFTTKAAGKGTGLGLATVHGIVAQHKGWVEVESEIGRGSRFRVLLPVTERSSADASTPSAEPPRRGNETILLVEDDPHLRRVVRRTLAAFGYQVLEASNGREATEIWRARGAEIDLLFTDMVMPEGMTGLELTERLQGERPGLKAIISSGYSQEMVETGGPRKPGISYLPKPFEAKTLATAIRNFLDRDA